MISYSKLAYDYAEALRQENVILGRYDTPDICPVCFEGPNDQHFSGFFSPIEANITSECSHYICIDCWKNIYETNDDVKCPLCRNIFPDDIYQVNIGTDI
jgi:hypothetical protein